MEEESVVMCSKLFRLELIETSCRFFVSSFEWAVGQIQKTDRDKYKSKSNKKSHNSPDQRIKSGTLSTRLFWEM